MAQRRLRFLALWIAGCMVCRPGHCAAVADHLDAAAAVRKADAAWKAAASNAGVDAWAAFYAADAVVSLPRAPLVSGTGPLRDAVSRLLALPRFSIAWRPIALEVARSGSGDCRPTEFGNAPPMIGTWMRPARRPPTHSRRTADAHRVDLWRDAGQLRGRDPQVLPGVLQKTYAFLFRGETLVDVRGPLPGDEIN
jgi:hypothetical protein